MSSWVNSQFPVNSNDTCYGKDQRKINLCVCVFQAVLQTGGQLELEVRPLFLVPDTNGFIDHLGGLKTLLQSGTYIIVVPLIGKTERFKKVNGTVI